MAHGGLEKYYNPANKVVNDGDTAFADDINNVNYAVDTALAQVADDLDVMDVKVNTFVIGAEAWANNDQGVPPDPLESARFSSKAYAIESKEYAIQAEGVPIHKADGTTQLIDSALVSATKAAASQADALASKNAAALSESNAYTYSTEAYNEQMAAADSACMSSAFAEAAEASANLAASSAANLPNATTGGPNVALTTNAAGDAFDYIPIPNLTVPAGVIVAFIGGYFGTSENGSFTNVVGNTVADVNTLLNSRGWYVCDGTALNLPASPIFNGVGRYLPNLTDSRFIHGSTSAGGVGGSNTTEHTHTISHIHSTANHTLTRAQTAPHDHAIGGWAHMAGSGQSYHDTTLRTTSYAEKWTTNSNGLGEAHNHGNTGAASVASSGSVSLENRPKFISCLYLMKVV